MTAVGFAVRTMHVKIGLVDYACAVTAVTDAAKADSITTQTACPDGTATDVGPAVWTLQVDYNISNVADSFHRILREQEGETATIIVEYDPIGEPGILTTYEVTMTPGGGAYKVGAFATASVTLPCHGAPVISGGA